MPSKLFELTFSASLKVSSLLLGKVIKDQEGQKFFKLVEKVRKLSKANKYFSDMYTSFQGRNLNRAINCLEGINKLPNRFNFSSLAMFLR